MRFKETFARLTGISVPFFGVQWNPPEADRAIAKRVIAFLEDRRVLYAPSEMEVPEHCVHSIVEIRSFLTSELGKLEETSELASSLRTKRGVPKISGHSPEGWRSHHPIWLLSWVAGVGLR